MRIKTFLQLRAFLGEITSDWSGASAGQIGRLKYTVQTDYNINILHTAEAQPVKGKGRARGEAPNGFDGSLKTSVRTKFVFRL